MPAAPLPDLDTLDPAALKEMIIKQHAQISSRDAELERLQLIIARLRRLQFGRKSEKIQRVLNNSNCSSRIWRRARLRKNSAQPTRCRRQQPRSLRA